jgi:hypothetical protein
MHDFDKEGGGMAGFS